MRIRKFNKSMLMSAVGTTLLLLSYQNCSKTKFSIDEGAKLKAITDSDVFGANDPSGVDPVVPVLDPTPTPVASATPVATPVVMPTPASGGGMDPVVAATPMPTPVATPVVPVNSGIAISLIPNSVCGPRNVHMTVSQASIMNTSKVIAALYLMQPFGQTLVQSWDSAADQASNYALLKALKPFSLKAKSALAPGQYMMVMYDGSRMSSAPSVTRWMDGANAVAPIADSVVHFMDYTSTFTIAENGIQKNPQSMNVMVGEDGDEVCKTAGAIDPLILQLKTEKPEPILLTGPEQGVMFDLLGQKNNHKKVQVSWFENAESENYFLVLPNNDGQVLGVDEMFGDTTMGPDKKFAKQGFAALAKHDDTADKLINEDDAVFSKLRLWKDRNLDGVVQANELFTLEEKGVVTIDLRYDKRFSQTDRHGNMTRYKSVALMNDGSYSLVFDLWLRYLGN